LDYSVNDPAIRELLEAARAWGVSPRRFLGWEPGQTTVYEYDDLGRVARATTTTEPEWDSEQRRAVLDLLALEAGQCPGGKHQLSETTLPENEDAYVAGPAVRCHYCTASDRAAKAYEDSPSPQALLIPIQLKGTRNGG
jgi:YD repeat-containing protein